jgi:predicted phosphodiesterase
MSSARLPGVGGYRDEVRRACRVAVLGDVHGNSVAMEAAASDVVRAAPDLVVFTGDLTWGPLPEETWGVIAGLADEFPDRVGYVRGNAERGLAELRAEPLASSNTPRERWMLSQHRDQTLDALAAFVPSLVVEVADLGSVCFCHGSPRSDEELITPATPAARMRELLAGVAESVLVSAHTHIQFDRRVEGVRSVSPGSVGMPYEERPGAYWALLGPGVELLRTEYDLDAAVTRIRASDDPLAEAMAAMLVDPPAPTVVIARAEELEFSR